MRKEDFEKLTAQSRRSRERFEELRSKAQALHAKVASTLKTEPQTKVEVQLSQ